MGVVKWSVENNVNHITFWFLSIANLSRSKQEVDSLFKIICTQLGPDGHIIKKLIDGQPPDLFDSYWWRKAFIGFLGQASTLLPAFTKLDFLLAMRQFNKKTPSSQDKTFT
jgi:undecaprenyl pyrophosphate synthase